MQIAEEINANAAPANAHAAGTLRTIERLLGSLVGIVAAALVVAEIIVLFAGVSSRYKPFLHPCPPNLNRNDYLDVRVGPRQNESTIEGRLQSDWNVSAAMELHS